MGFRLAWSPRIALGLNLTQAADEPSLGLSLTQVELINLHFIKFTELQAKPKLECELTSQASSLIKRSLNVDVIWIQISHGFFTHKFDLHCVSSSILLHILNM